MRTIEVIKLFLVKFIYFYRHFLINLLQKNLFDKQINPKKIVIHRVAAFGDTIVSLPAINNIRNFYPNAQIDIVSTKCSGINISHILEDSQLVNNIYIYKKEDMKKALNHLKKTNYDLYIEIPQNLNLYKSIRNMLTVRFYLKIKSAFGWDKGRIKSLMDIQKKYHLVPKEVDRFIKILKENGITSKEKVSFPIVPKLIKSNQLCINLGNETNIAFLIGGKIQAKKWPLKNWIELSKKINNKCNIYIIGGKDEFEEADTICKNSINCINLCGKLDILETASFLKEMNFCISLDTGSMHLSYAVDTPVIALMSTRDLTDKWYPYNTESIVLEKVLDCSFCLKKTCLDNQCMKQITVDEVYDKYLKLRNRY